MSALEWFLAAIVFLNAFALYWIAGELVAIVQRLTSIDNDAKATRRNVFRVVMSANLCDRGIKRVEQSVDGLRGGLNSHVDAFRDFVQKATFKVRPHRKGHEKR